MQIGAQAICKHLFRSVHMNKNNKMAVILVHVPNTTSIKMILWKDGKKYNLDLVDLLYKGIKFHVNV